MAGTMIASASDIPPIVIVAAMMVFAFACAVAMDLPMKWVVPALAGVALFNGYVLSAILAVIIVWRFQDQWETVLPGLTNWFEVTLPEWIRHSSAGGIWGNGQKRDSSSRPQSERTGQRSNQDPYHWGWTGRTRAKNPFGRARARAKRSNTVNPEAVLGLSGDFTMKELDAARRRLAKTFHPDLHRRASIKKQAHMAEKMRAVNSAYETLKRQIQNPAQA